jgi:hypothetical protein
MKNIYTKTTSLPAYSVFEGAWDLLKSKYSLDYKVSKCLIPFMKKKHTFIRLGSFRWLSNKHFHAKEQMQNFEALSWKPPWTNRKLQRMFLTGINNSNYQFKEDDGCVVIMKKRKNIVKLSRRHNQRLARRLQKRDLCHPTIHPFCHS